MEGTSGMETYERGLGGLGCQKIMAWDTKQGGEEEKNILLSAYSVPGTVHRVSLSNWRLQCTVGRVRRGM